MELTSEQRYTIGRGLDNLIQIQEYEQKNFKVEYTNALFTEELLRKGNLVATTKEITRLQELKQIINSGHNGIYVISKDLKVVVKND